MDMFILYFLPFKLCTKKGRIFFGGSKGNTMTKEKSKRIVMSKMRERNLGWKEEGRTFSGERFWKIIGQDNSGHIQHQHSGVVQPAMQLRNTRSGLGPHYTQLFQREKIDRERKRQRERQLGKARNLFEVHQNNQIYLLIII